MHAPLPLEYLSNIHPNAPSTPLSLPPLLGAETSMSMSLSHQSSDFDIYVGNKRGGKKSTVAAGGQGAAAAVGIGSRATTGGPGGGRPTAGPPVLGASPGQAQGLAQGRGLARGDLAHKGNQDHDDDNDLEDSEEQQHPRTSPHHQPHSHSQQQEQSSSPSSSVFRRVIATTPSHATNAAPTSTNSTPTSTSSADAGGALLDSSFLSVQTEDKGPDNDKGKGSKPGGASIPGGSLGRDVKGTGGGRDGIHPQDADPRRGHGPGARPGGGGGGSGVHGDMMLDTSLSVLEASSSFEASASFPGNGQRHTH